MEAEKTKRDVEDIKIQFDGTAQRLAEKYPVEYNQLKEESKKENFNMSMIYHYAYENGQYNLLIDRAISVDLSNDLFAAFERLFR